MASIVINIKNIVSPKDFTVWYKKSDMVGDFIDGFTQYGNVFSGGTTDVNITITDFTDYGDQYWIKIQEYNTGRTDNPFIIENIKIHSLEYFLNFCEPEPDPTPTPTPTQIPLTPSITPTTTPTPGLTPTTTPTPTEIPVTPSITPTITPTPGLSPSPTPSPTRTPTLTPTITPTTSPTMTVTPTITKTPTHTPTPTRQPIGYTYYVFNKCNGDECYMSLSTYNFYVGLYGPTYFQLGNRYFDDNQTDVYIYSGNIEILYDANPSCLITYVSLITLETIYYNGFYVENDPSHPNGGTIVYRDECNIEQTIEFIYLRNDCQTLTNVISVVSHSGTTIDCDFVYYGYLVKEWLAPYPSETCVPSNTYIIASRYDTAQVGRFYRSNNLIEDCIFEVLETNIDVSGGGYLITTIAGEGFESCGPPLTPLDPF